MVIHVVAAEIGEGTGGELDAIETALIETVAGSLHRAMGHALAREFGQQKGWHLPCGATTNVPATCGGTASERP